MNRSVRRSLALFGALLLVGACESRGSLDPTDGTNPPPVASTIFLDPNLIRESDPTVFDPTGVVYEGQALRSMFDRRIDDYVSVNAHIFQVTFSDGIVTETQVNPEFGTENDARQQLVRYATALGRVPATLRDGVDTLWIHDGVHPVSGTDGALLIHVGQAFQYDFQDVLEEVLLHETVHSALDVPHATSAGWLAAQESDPNFISATAQAFPEIEDLAESFTAWVAAERLSARIEGSLVRVIRETIPARLDYLNSLNVDLSPLR